MNESASPACCRFYRLIPGAPEPRRADRSADGTLPVIATMGTLNRLSRDRAERPALQSYVRARLRPVFDKLGWDGSGSGDDDLTLLRGSLIRTLGEFGDQEILAEARRRFADRLSSSPPAPVRQKDQGGRPDDGATTARESGA